MRFQEDMLPWYGNHYPIEFEIRRFFERYSSLTLSEIKALLSLSKEDYNEDICIIC